MDSMGSVSNKTTVGNFLLEYLEKEFIDRMGADGTLFIKATWTVDTTTISPQQYNGYDCGVFSVLNFIRIFVMVANGRLSTDLSWAKVFSRAEKRDIRITMYAILVQQNVSVTALLSFINDHDHNDANDERRDDNDNNDNNDGLSTVNNTTVNATATGDDLHLQLSSLHKSCQVVVTVKINNELVEFRRAESSQATKVSFFITPGRRKKYGIPLLYHYHEYTGKQS